MYVQITAISYPKNTNSVEFTCKSLEWIRSFDAVVDDAVYTFTFDNDLPGAKKYLYKVVSSQAKMFGTYRDCIDDLLGKQLFLADGFLTSKVEPVMAEPIIEGASNTKLDTAKVPMPAKAKEGGKG